MGMQDIEQAGYHLKHDTGAEIHSLQGRQNVANLGCRMGCLTLETEMFCMGLPLNRCFASVEKTAIEHLINQLQV